MVQSRTARALRIAGQVQGVGYRMWLVGVARGRGLDGWVRNRRDGSVEALVAGPEEALDAVTEACRRGPRAARVTDVRAAPADDPGRTGFVQRPDG